MTLLDVNPQPPTRIKLTGEGRLFVSFIEQWWFTHDDINEKIPPRSVIIAGTGLQPHIVDRLTKNADVNAALESRGIILADISQLLPEQLAAANVVLDFSDPRPQRTKLKDLGVSKARYDGWMKTEKFQRYLRQRAEALLGENQHEAHVSLLRNVQRGDMNAIKYYNEITGRWSSKTVSDLNVEFLLVKVVEAVQKYVSDPIILQQIAAELGALVGGNNDEGLQKGGMLTEEVASPYSRQQLVQGGVEESDIPPNSDSSTPPLIMDM